MKRVIGGVLALAAGAVVVGPRPSAAMGAADPGSNSASGADVVATVNGKPITMAELQKPLVEAYGLKILLFEIQLNLAKQVAQEKKITYAEADFAAELDRTLKAGFQDAPKEDYPALLDQLLQKQGISRAEFDMVLQVNAILRKIAEPELKDKLTDAMLKEAFNQMYGESVVVRHIQVANPQEAQLAKTRLAAGEKFETLVQAMSRNGLTVPLGGELPPFSRNTETWPGNWGKVPANFKEWAFNAKVGDVSEPIGAYDAYHILKLERRNEPKVVKFEDVKAGLQAQLQEQLVQGGIQELRKKLAQMARQTMQIKDPVLKAQFDKKIAEQAKAAEADKARQDLINKAKTGQDAAAPGAAPGAVPQAATPSIPGTLVNPSGAPAGGPASPANAPAGERPPASKSAAPRASDTPPSK